MKEKQKKFDFASILAIIIGSFTIILQIFPPVTVKDKIASALYFLAILSYLLSDYFLSGLRLKIKEFIEKIEDHEKRINELKSQMETEKRFLEFEKRIFAIENTINIFKNKRGQFEGKIRWIFLGILLVLFYLYLRSLGIVK